MLYRLATRLLRSALACTLVLACMPVCAQRGRGAHGPTAPQQPSGSRPGSIGPGPNHEHLAQWMSRHSSLPLPEQQRALEHEPGFRQLAPDVQQRMHSRLSQLNDMSPERRRHVIDRTEAMERLSPDQRQEVRGAMSNLRSLPLERRRVVARAFRDLRSQSPAERQATLQSQVYRSQFSPEERSTLNNLVHVEPLLPPQP